MRSLLATCLMAALVSIACGCASAEDTRVATAAGELTCEEISERLGQLTLLRKADNDACLADSECASAPHDTECGDHCFVAVRRDRLERFAEDLDAVGSDLCGTPEYPAICGVTYFFCAERTPRCMESRCAFPQSLSPPVAE